MNLRLKLHTAVFVALCAICGGAAAQAATPSKACPTVKELKPEQLYGRWAVRFTAPPPGLPAQATMLLERHAEFSESLAGSISRDFGRIDNSKPVASHADKAAIAGDFEEGFLLLDESSDMISITGTWNGEMVEGSCGKAFKGSWKDTSRSAPDNAPDIAFTLTKMP